MTAWKLVVAVAVAAVGFSSRADAQVSVGIPGVGSVTVGDGSTYYSPYSSGTYYTPGYSGYVVPAGFTTGTYNYPVYSNYYSGTTYAYPTTYGTTYSYPMTYSSGYSYPTYTTSNYYPTYSGYTYPMYSGYYSNAGYYNPGWGWNGYGYGNDTFRQGFGSGVVSGALGVPNYGYGYGGYGGYWGGNTVQGTVGNYLGREVGRAIFR